MKDRFNKKVPIFLIKNKSDLKNNPNGVISYFKDDVETIKKSLKNEKNQKPDELDDYIKFKEISLKSKNGFDDFILSLCKELSLYQEQKSLHYKYIGINSVIIFNDCKKKSNSIINILLLGDKDVGKTTFCNYFLEENKKINERTEDLKIMAEVLGKNIFVKICKIDDMNKLQTIFYEPEFFLLFFDVGNKQSFENLEKWISKIRVNKNNYKIILLGNKIDRNDVRIIGKQEALSIADKYSIKYYECSCLCGINIYEILSEAILSGFKEYKLCIEKENDKDEKPKELTSDSSGCQIFNQLSMKIENKNDNKQKLEKDEKQKDLSRHQKHELYMQLENGRNKKQKGSSSYNPCCSCGIY